MSYLFNELTQLKQVDSLLHYLHGDTQAKNVLIYSYLSILHLIHNTMIDKSIDYFQKLHSGLAYKSSTLCETHRFGIMTYIEFGNWISQLFHNIHLHKYILYS